MWLLFFLTCNNSYSFKYKLWNIEMYVLKNMHSSDVNDHM